MKERPILFSGAMVRALLSDAKTQTRRVVTPQPQHAQLHEWKGKVIRDCEHRTWCWKQHDFGDGDALNANPGHEMAALSPYGVPGDRLWVREAWYYDGGDTREIEPDERDLRLLEYRADHDCRSWEAGCPCKDENGRSSWRPSIHMPRWASRLSLHVTSLRAERLQDISEKDAIAEGVRGTESQHGVETSAVDEYRRLWDEINGKRAPWSSSPWVWVVTFKRVDETQKVAANA